MYKPLQRTMKKNKKIRLVYLFQIKDWYGIGYIVLVM